MREKTASPKGETVLSKTERDEFVDRASAQPASGIPLSAPMKIDPDRILDQSVRPIMRDDGARAGAVTRLITDEEAKDLIKTTATILGGVTSALELQEQAKAMPFSELTKAIEFTEKDIKSTMDSLKYNKGMLADVIKRETNGGELTLEEVKEDHRKRPRQNSIHWFEMMVEMKENDLAKEETRLRIFKSVRDQRMLDGENKE